MLSQSHLFSPNYPRFAPIGGVTQELGRGGDSSRKHSKYSPPWVCSKCARKHPDEMGCGEAARRGEIIEPSDVEYDYVETTQDIDEALGHIHKHRSLEEQLGCDKCKEGQRKKRRRAAAAAAFANPYSTLRGYNAQGVYRVMNLGHTHRNALGQQEQALTCPAGAPPTSWDPNLNCMRDARGNAVCSDGQFYPPGCPHTPPDQYFTPGISPDQVQGGILQAQIPPPRGAGSPSAPGAPSQGTSTGTIVAAGAGALGIGTLLFFLFK